MYINKTDRTHVYGAHISAQQAHTYIHTYIHTCILFMFQIFYATCYMPHQEGILSSIIVFVHMYASIVFDMQARCVIFRDDGYNIGHVGLELHILYGHGRKSDRPAPI